MPRGGDQTLLLGGEMAIEVGLMETGEVDHSTNGQSGIPALGGHA
jgi:hypothetical protein